jgi:Uncharacterized protein conserved in bacteria (DUF2130)
VPKGKEGADITQGFMENRKEIGEVIWEVKNASRWQEPYAPKLYADQVRENAEWAVCVLGPAAFPPDTRPQPMAYKEILLCPHEDVVSLMEILRRCSVTLHRARAAGNDAGAAKAKMFDFFASGAPNGRKRRERDRSSDDGFHARKCRCFRARDHG